MRGRRRALSSGGLLVLYGPFMLGGAHTAPSNASFDLSLRARESMRGENGSFRLPGSTAAAYLHTLAEAYSQTGDPGEAVALMARIQAQGLDKGSFYQVELDRFRDLERQFKRKRLESRGPKGKPVRSPREDSPLNGAPQATGASPGDGGPPVATDGGTKPETLDSGLNPNDQRGCFALLLADVDGDALLIMEGTPDVNHYRPRSTTTCTAHGSGRKIGVVLHILAHRGISREQTAIVFLLIDIVTRCSIVSVYA